MAEDTLDTSLAALQAKYIEKGDDFTAFTAESSQSVVGTVHAVRGVQHRGAPLSDIPS